MESANYCVEYARTIEPSFSPVPSMSPSLRPSAPLRPSSSPTDALPEETYVPGDLDHEENGLLLSRGLTARVIATSGSAVVYSDGSRSASVFHGDPDGAAVFPHPNGDGWAYVSNSETSGEGKGGVGALIFDNEGEVIEYKTLLAGRTERNCSGGATPWNTWVSCEEISSGRIWEMHPFGDPVFGGKVWHLTAMHAGFADRFEGVAFDNRVPHRPVAYITIDSKDGELRRFEPDQDAVQSYIENGIYSDILSQPGKTTYLVLVPNGTGLSGTYYWTNDRQAAATSADLHYNNCEGIEIDPTGTLFFTCKLNRELFALHLDHNTYTKSFTTTSDLIGTPDQLRLCALGDRQMLYFAEDGGGCGIHARDADGLYVAVARGLPTYTSETTGVAFSPDKRHLYFSVQRPGIIFDVTRMDGYSFSGEWLGPRRQSDIASADAMKNMLLRLSQVGPKVFTEDSHDEII